MKGLKTNSSVTGSKVSKGFPEGLASWVIMWFVLGFLLHGDIIDSDDHVRREKHGHKILCRLGSVINTIPSMLLSHSRNVIGYLLHRSIS